MERNSAHRTSKAFEDVYRGNRGNTDFYGTLGVFPKAIKRHAFNGSVHLRGKFRIGSHESEPADFLENLSRGRLRTRYLHVLQWTVGRAVLVQLVEVTARVCFGPACARQRP